MPADLSALNQIAGFIGGCLVDSETGLMLATEGGDSLAMETASAATTEVVKAKQAALSALGLDEDIEDILITMGTEYHLIRPLDAHPSVFLYTAIDRSRANLGMARLQVKNVEAMLTL